MRAAVGRHDLELSRREVTVNEQLFDGRAKTAATFGCLRTSMLSMGWLGSAPAYRSGVVSPRSRTRPVPHPTSSTEAG